jgi:hypothetical protein
MKRLFDLLRRKPWWLAPLTLATMACGDGSVAVVWAPTTGFIVWIGNSRGDRVVDGRNQLFAFAAGSRCLYNFQTGSANDAFCLLTGSGQVVYGAFRGEVTNVHAADGSCVAALTDPMTGNFIDVAVAPYGREVVVATARRPERCMP